MCNHKTNMSSDPDTNQSRLDLDWALKEFVGFFPFAMQPKVRLSQLQIMQNSR